MRIEEGYLNIIKLNNSSFDELKVYRYRKTGRVCIEVTTGGRHKGWLVKNAPLYEILELARLLIHKSLMEDENKEE